MRGGDRRAYAVTAREDALGAAGSDPAPLPNPQQLQPDPPEHVPCVDGAQNLPHGRAMVSAEFAFRDLVEVPEQEGCIAGEIDDD
jgi:hypothetical protein